MVARSTAVLGLGFVCAAVMAYGQSPVVLSPASTVPAASADASSSACSPGFAEIVATHFRVNGDPNGAVLRRGTLKIMARRGWVEERGSTLISYRVAGGTLVPELDVPIRDGALDHPACVPFTSVYVTSPMRYQMTVTDDSTGSTLLLLATADMTQPRYFLDDDGLYRTEAGDDSVPGSNGSLSKTPLGSSFKACAEATWCGRE